MQEKQDSSSRTPGSLGKVGVCVCLKCHICSYKQCVVNVCVADSLSVCRHVILCLLLIPHELWSYMFFCVFTFCVSCPFCLSMRHVTTDNVESGLIQPNSVRVCVLSLHIFIISTVGEPGLCSVYRLVLFVCHINAV